jgi:DNA-binding CsgD family transcriptional regulator
MEKESFHVEFNRLLHGYLNNANPVRQNGEDLYLTMLNFFLVGDSFYFILNHHLFAAELVSKEVESILGYPPEDFNMDMMNELIHPEDRSWFLTFGDYALKFFAALPTEKYTKYKVRYDIRLRKSNGEYIRVLYQGILIEHDGNGGFLRTFNVLADISYLKKETVPVLSFVGIDEEPSYCDVARSNMFSEDKNALTSREKQVLNLLMDGKLSKEISNILHISKQTVDTHRKNMLRKKNLNNTGELIGKAMRYGWI